MNKLKVVGGLIITACSIYNLVVFGKEIKEEIDAEEAKKSEFDDVLIPLIDIETSEITGFETIGFSNARERSKDDPKAIEKYYAKGGK